MKGTRYGHNRAGVTVGGQQVVYLDWVSFYLPSLHLLAKSKSRSTTMAGY